MDTMGYLAIILALMLDIVCRISGQIYLTTDENPIQGTPFTFVCRTTTLSKTVTFFDPQDRIAGSCLFPEYNCDSGYDYKLSQNISALRTFLTIGNLNRSLHQGNWKCKYGQERAQMNLSVMTFPDRVHLEGLQTDVDLSGTPLGIINITCSCSCSYPDAMIGLSLAVGKNEYPLQSYTYKKQSIDTNYICTDPLENAYTSQFSLNIGKEIPQLTSRTARLKCYVTISAVKVPVFGMSVGKIIFPDSSTTPPQNTKTTTPKDTSTTPPPLTPLETAMNGLAVVLSSIMLLVVCACLVINFVICCRRIRNCNDCIKRNRNLPIVSRGDNFQWNSSNGSNTTQKTELNSDSSIERYSRPSQYGELVPSNYPAPARVMSNLQRQMSNGDEVEYIGHRITYCNDTKTEERDIWKYKKGGN